MYTGTMFLPRGACTIDILCSVVGGQMLDNIRDRFTDGYFRQQPGDALKVAKVLCIYYLLFDVYGGKRIADRWLWMLVEDQTRWESFPWGVLVSDIGYIFERCSHWGPNWSGSELPFLWYYIRYYDLGLRGYTFVRLLMWDHSRSFFHPATSLYTLEVEKVGSCCFYHILR
ncbi:hypothetical protein OROGR_023684 [Orobanche gracilis]